MHSNNFDLIRLVAALGVFFSHGIFFYSNNTPSFFNKTQSFGSLSVYIFFIVSGYLIYLSLIKDFNLFRFFIKRVARIFPGLFFAAIFSVFLVGWVNTSFDKFDYFLQSELWRTFLNYVFGIGHYHSLPGVFEGNIFPKVVNGSLWTIKYELMCYLILFLIFRMGGEKNFVIRVIILLCVCLCIIFFETKKNIFYFFDTYDLAVFLYCFNLGVLFACMHLEGMRRSMMTIFCLMCWALALLLREKPHTDVAIGIFLLFLVMSVAFSRMKVKISNDISYGIYIYAFPIQQIVTEYGVRHGYSLGACLLLALAWTVVMAWLSWIYVEQPAMLWARRRIQKSLPSTTAGQAQG